MTTVLTNWCILEVSTDSIKNRIIKKAVYGWLLKAKVCKGSTKQPLCIHDIVTNDVVKGYVTTFSGEQIELDGKGTIYQVTESDLRIIEKGVTPEAILRLKKLLQLDSIPKSFTPDDIFRELENDRTNGLLCKKIGLK